MKTVVKLSLLAFAAAGLATPALAQSKLRPGDSVSLSISGVPAEEVPQVTKEYQIDQNGTISLVYIGTVSAAGRSPAELARNIEGAYRSAEIYTNPSISVSTTATTSQRFVSIGGQVRTPGRVPYTEDMTLMGAINAAGEFTPFADKAKVTLYRDGQAATMDVRNIAKNPSLDVRLKPGDRIDVKERPF